MGGHATVDEEFKLVMKREWTKSWKGALDIDIVMVPVGSLCGFPGWRVIVCFWNYNHSAFRIKVVCKQRWMFGKPYVWHFDAKYGLRIGKKNERKYSFSNNIQQCFKL